MYFSFLPDFIFYFFDSCILVANEVEGSESRSRSVIEIESPRFRYHSGALVIVGNSS